MSGNDQPKRDSVESVRIVPTKRQKRFAISGTSIGLLIGLIGTVAAILSIPILQPYLTRGSSPPPDARLPKASEDRIDVAVRAASRQCLLNLATSEKREIETNVSTRLKYPGVAGTTSVETTQRSISEALSEPAQIQLNQELHDCMATQIAYFLSLSAMGPTPRPNVIPPRPSPSPDPTITTLKPVDTTSPTAEPTGSPAGPIVLPDMTLDTSRDSDRQKGGTRPSVEKVAIRFGPSEYQTQLFHVELMPCSWSAQALDCYVRVKALSDRSPSWWIDKGSTIQEVDGVAHTASWAEAGGNNFYEGAGGRSTQLTPNLATLVHYHYDNIADPMRVRTFTLTLCCTRYQTFFRQP